MKFEIKKSVLSRFLDLCSVSGKLADGSTVTYYTEVVIEVSEEENEIRCLMMFHTVQYIDIISPAKVTSGGNIAFNIKDMKSAISDLEGDNITIEISGKTIRVEDDNEWNLIPSLETKLEFNPMYKRAKKFQQRLDWDDSGFYFVFTDGSQTLQYPNTVTLKANDLLSKMKRPNYIKSVYYHLYTKGGKLGVEVINAKKKGLGKKFRWVNVSDHTGKFDVEYKEALQPVMNTIRNGTVIIYHMGQKQIPSIVYYEEESGVRGIFIVTLKTNVEETPKRGEGKAKRKKPEEEEEVDEVDELEEEEDGEKSFDTVVEEVVSMLAFYEDGLTETKFHTEIKKMVDDPSPKTIINYMLESELISVKGKGKAKKYISLIEEANKEE